MSFSGTSNSKICPVKMLSSQEPLIHSFYFSTTFANNLAQKFLSVIYVQCSECEDEPDNLMQFLSTDYGCHLLLALNCFSSHVCTFFSFDQMTKKTICP